LHISRCHARVTVQVDETVASQAGGPIRALGSFSTIRRNLKIPHPCFDTSQEYVAQTPAAGCCGGLKDSTPTGYSPDYVTYTVSFHSAISKPFLEGPYGVRESSSIDEISLYVPDKDCIFLGEPQEQGL
jgi:hypothetical protein